MMIMTVIMMIMTVMMMIMTVIIMIMTVMMTMLMVIMLQNQRNLTLMWKRETREKVGTKILTANTAAITSDPRVSVIHEDGGQVYVLVIR